MKVLLVVLILLPCAGFCQSKNDTKIIVVVDDTINVLNRIASILYDKGYSMEEKDESVGFLMTKEKFERQ